MPRWTVDIDGTLDDFGSLRLVKGPGARTMSGNVGAGTGQVAVSTVSGAITLLRRTPLGADAPHAQAGTESETR